MQCSTRDPLLGDPTPENGGWAMSEPKLPIVDTAPKVSADIIHFINTSYKHFMNIL